MENKIQMVDDDQVENVGIMAGFMDEIDELMAEIAEDDREDAEGSDMARMMARTPDSPEILMNNLRGDMRSIDARREELADLVGLREAEETPEGVLALLQPVLAQQQAAPAMPMMPAGPAPMPQGMPPEMAGMAPPPMPAGPAPAMGGIGGLPMDQGPAPMAMANGGMVQYFQEGSGEEGVTPNSGAYPPEVVAAAIARYQAIMNQQPETVPDLRAGVDQNLALYQDILGSDPRDTQAQMLFDIGQAALGYAGNVGPDGQPLRGSGAARLAGATRELPGRIGARAAGMSKEAQALKMAALQAAEGQRTAAQERNLALSERQGEIYKDVVTQEPAARMLTPGEVTAMGLDPERGAWGIDGKNKPFLAGGNPPVGPTFNLGDGGGLTPGQKKMDEAFAPINLEWLSGGGPDMGSQIASLAVVARQLEEGEVNLTGLDVGMLPDVVNYFINPMALDARDNVEAVVQRNLRLILGAQFTAKEGERLIARAYNPDLPEAQNASRVRRLLLQMTTAAAQKQAMSDHFMKEGTLKGWTGAMPTIGDFEKAIDGAPGFTVNDIVGDSARGRSLLEDED